jgi:hypothetical protein
MQHPCMNPYLKNSANTPGNGWMQHPCMNPYLKNSANTNIYQVMTGCTFVILSNQSSQDDTWARTRIKFVILFVYI